MNRDEIRKQTCIIIRKNRQYLQGRDMLSRQIKWTESAYAAWRTRDMEMAESVARRTGGVMVLFNPILGKTKVMGA